jgi:predicted nucleic acid-binding Zn ribbon protein
MRPDPERVRLAAEALARARADAWARGERPSTAARPPQPSSDSSERKGVAASGLLSPGWSARPRREDPQSLNAAVGGLLSARGWRQRAAVGAVFGGWAEIVGPQLAAHTRPESFDDGELVVSADSAAWATQVRLLAPQLLRRLAEELGTGTVRKVRVRPGGYGGRGAPSRRLWPGGMGGRAVPPCAGGSGGSPPRANTNTYG